MTMTVFFISFNESDVKNSTRDKTNNTQNHMSCCDSNVAGLYDSRLYARQVNTSIHNKVIKLHTLKCIAQTHFVFYGLIYR